LDPEKYNKSTMPATYTLVTMDMATDKATIRSSENPIAFQVEAHLALHGFSSLQV